MADLDEAMRDLARQISVWLAPLQPNVPGLYPNLLPSAGVIPATLIASGYPIQTHVMKRLENKLAQVAVFDLKQGSVFPFLDRRSPQVNLPAGGSGTGTEYVESAREKKHIAIQVWSFSQASRQILSHWLRVQLKDAYRLKHQDGSVTLLKYIRQESEDMETADTVYSRTFMYEADITELSIVDATEVTEIDSNVTVIQPGSSLNLPSSLTVDTL